MTFPNLNNIVVTGLNNIVSAFNRLQNQVQVFIDAINRKPQLDSIPLLNITLVAGNNQVPHTLGKVLTGWTLADVSAAATVYRYAPSNNTTLFLHASQPCTVNLVVW